MNDSFMNKHIFLSFSELLPQRFGMHANDLHLFPTMLKTFYKNRRPEEGKKLWNNIIFHNFFAFPTTYAFVAFLLINPELQRILRTEFESSFLSPRILFNCFASLLRVFKTKQLRNVLERI